MALSFTRMSSKSYSVNLNRILHHGAVPPEMSTVSLA